MKNKEIRLQGGKIYLTREPDSTFLIREGTVFVYILPVKRDGQMGRRLFLYEAKEKEIIPALSADFNDTSWFFGLVALNKAVVEEMKNNKTPEIEESFVRKAKLKNIGEDSFASLLLEVYDRNNIKVEGEIFARQKEQEETQSRGLRLIYQFFDRKTLHQVTPESGNGLYDAVAYVCDSQNIRIASYEKIISGAGRRFKLKDVARVSGFITREVLLEHDWQKRDSDSLIGFLENGHKAVALLPEGTGGYMAYNPQTHERVKVDAAYEKTLEGQAYAIYAPFPNRPMNIKEMFLFGFKHSKIHDWVRFAVLMLLGTLIGILLPMLNQQIYDNYIPIGWSEGIVHICGVLLACNVGNLTFTIVKNLSALRGMSHMKNSVLAAACERVFNLPESFYRNYKAADLSDRILKIDQIYNAMSSVAIKTFVSAGFSVLYLFQMKKYAEELLFPAILMVSIVFALTVLFAVRQTGYEEESLETDAEARSRLFQYLSGIQKIRASGVEDRALLEYLKPYAREKEINMRKERYTNIVNVINLSASAVFSLVLYYLMAQGMKEGTIALSIGGFSAFMSAFGSFSAAILEVGGSLLKLNGLIPMLNRLKPILEAVPEYEEDSELPGEISGDIEIANVDFSYTEGEEMILKDISMHIKPGEYIGIAGSSGCGKSTLLKLLLGFEKPVSGKIFYDAKDIEGMAKRELRKKFGVVLQEGRLISGSIFDNITIAVPGATLEDAKRAATAAGLMEDIEKMPMGMHTVVSEMGGTISGGQLQRILIARAVAGNPKILFFDEATSALDNVTQAQVCESLSKLHVTRVVIAHRLSTIADCDRIFVMDQGKIAEEGNFETLMKKKGLFYNLASRQMA